MSEPVGADRPVARDGEGQLSKDALRTPAPRLIEDGRLAPRLGCQLAATIPLHATDEARVGSRRYRVYLESASDSVAPEHLRGACGRVIGPRLRARAALRDQKRISGGAFWNVQTSNGVTLVAYGSENN